MAKKKNSIIDISQGLVPPNNIEVERAVLGAMLQFPEAVTHVLTNFSVQHKSENNEGVFYDIRHQHIYNAIVELIKRNSAVDILTVSSQLERIGGLDEVGGSHYLTELAFAIPTYAHIEHHTNLLLEYYLRREVIRSSQTILSNAHNLEIDSSTLLNTAVAEMFRLEEEKETTKKYQDATSVVMDTQTEINAMFNSNSIGISTGFKKLDDLLNGGLQKSDLLVIGARPSMGKTAFALALTLNLAMKKHPVAFFSLEMANTKLMKRLLSSKMGKNTDSVIRSKDADSLVTITQTLSELSTLPIFFDDTSSIPIMELYSKARRMKQQHNIELVIVDYVGLIKSPEAQNREREIAIISATLKQLAKELNIPVIALAQLNREVERRKADGDIDPTRTPILSDLRESGSLEQDADVVMFIHRPEHVLKQTLQELERTLEDTTASSGDKIKAEERLKNYTNKYGNKAWICIEKHRNGPTGRVTLDFFKEYGRFQSEAGIEDSPIHEASSTIKIIAPPKSAFEMPDVPF